MATLAWPIEQPKSADVMTTSELDADAAWAAFERRDRTWDGRVIGAVRTTGIYCKPSCPAKRPKRENVEFSSLAIRRVRQGFGRACAAGRTRSAATARPLLAP